MNRRLPACVVVAACACVPSGQGGNPSPGTSGASGTMGGGAPAMDAPGAAGSGGSPTSSPIDVSSSQLLTVVSTSWDAVPATLRRYERSGATWAAVGDPVPVVLGKSGLGWGVGLHPPVGDGGPGKHEGDGRSPAGIFALGSAFGYASASAAAWISMPYVEATADLECVDDPASAHYNTLVHRSAIASVDWSSSETMLRSDALYRWGLFVEHNAHPPVAGAGSCIFVHLWSGPASSTVGCTAGDEAEIRAVLAWLEPERHPVLVQLPQAVYDARRVEWALP